MGGELLLLAVCVCLGLCIFVVGSSILRLAAVARNLPHPEFQRGREASFFVSQAAEFAARRVRA